MPVYEYQCQQCGVFEATQKITERPLQRCPSCKGKVKRLISNTSFQLKGSGWYLTDYARKNSAPKEEKADGKGKASDTGTKDSSDKKSEKSETSKTPAA